MGGIAHSLAEIWRGLSWRGLLRFSPGKTAPREVFQRFRAVLDSNNRALELIADLGEKGSGDFIFDQRYIEQALADLHDTITGSVDALNGLCGNRFPELAPIVSRLAQSLEETMSGREERLGPLVQGLETITPDAWGRVGGKAGHLAELRRIGEIVVPDGFVITTRAFHDLLDMADLRKEYETFRTSTDEEVVERCRATLARGVTNAAPPPDLLSGIAAALRRMPRDESGEKLTLAVRSSAPEEDQEYSFAGQFQSILNVAPAAEAVFAAYRRVAASLFDRTAVYYYDRMFPGDRDPVMAACCQRMVYSAVSGVAYTLDPARPLAENMVVAGAWGLGSPVVAGKIATDYFVLSKSLPSAILEERIADKATGLYFQPGVGHRFVDLPRARRRQPCLQGSQLRQLAEQLVGLENRFRRPLDVEWTFDAAGQLFILQARPLRIPVSGQERRQLAEGLNRHELIAAGLGKVAQQGVGCGVVYPVRSSRDLDDFPVNGVLISRRDSSRFVKVMDRAAAILTETGTPVSHMATLCRELRVPCLVGVAGILDKLRPGEEITVDAVDGRIYRGRVAELLAYRAGSGMQLAVSREFRLLRRLLKKISLLNLVDPLLDNFTVTACRTYHDVLRFVHEKAVRELVELGRDEKGLLRDNIACHLHLPVPVGVIVIDIGGGLVPGTPPDRVDFQAVLSEPFRAILRGMLFPEVWHLASMPVGIRDLMSSMLSAPAASLDGSYTGHNIAIIGANYVNLCFRLGYHFNIIDAYCSDKERDNHIYFRFLGGASDLAKRSRRAMLIEKILVEFDFRIKTRGDLVIARHGNLIRADMERILDILGRLVGFTRQLDVRLDSEGMVDYYAEAFLMGNYGVLASRG
ncbi:MAG: hypothetical protein HY885_04695 [Deltaproteobacteria bacterium]|nr:hypothetical protein [Deltaproteobacteria bacterium]